MTTTTHGRRTKQQNKANAQGHIHAWLANSEEFSLDTLRRHLRTVCNGASVFNSGWRPQQAWLLTSGYRPDSDTEVTVQTLSAAIREILATNEVEDRFASDHRSQKRAATESMKAQARGRAACLLWALLRPDEATALFNRPAPQD